MLKMHLGLTMAVALATGCGDDGLGNDGDGADGGDGGQTTGPPRVCPPNRVIDASFEDGSPNPFWDENSFLYDNVICDEACAMDGELVAHAGEHAVWFGGIARGEIATISQVLDLPAGEARLRFWLGIDTGPLRNGDDRFTVRLGDSVLFSATEADTDEHPAYTEIVVETRIPTPGPRELNFEAMLSGSHITSFFVDDVSVTVCADPTQPPPDTGDGTDDGTGTGTGTGTGGTSGSDTGSDTSATDDTGATTDTSTSSATGSSTMSTTP